MILNDAALPSGVCMCSVGRGLDDLDGFACDTDAFQQEV